MKKTWVRIMAFLLLAAMLTSLMGCTETPPAGSQLGTGGGTGATGPSETDPPEFDYDFTVSYDGITKKAVPAMHSVHDPSILQVGDKYYIYGSHMSSAHSNNLISWYKMSDGYNGQNPIFGQIYDEDVYDKAFAWSGALTSTNPVDEGTGERVWAPDVIYNEAMGKYVMYYCVTSTWNTSNLCYGVSDTPDGRFEWQGTLICSGFSRDTIGKTNVLDVVDEDYALDTYLNGAGTYQYKEYPNALDPSVFYDEDGRMWMVYGSWSGGIFLLELDPATGTVIHPEADPDNRVDPYFGKKLLGGDHKSIEAPYILYAGGYYYLFVSYGGLTREGGYQIRVFRSDKPNGEYVDMNGMTPFGGGHHVYGLKLSGNYDLPSVWLSYMATGHNSAFVDKNDGKMYVVYHTRFDNNTEMHSPRVHQMLLNKEGWPCELPYQTSGETVSETGYETSEVVGRYFVINQGTKINAEIARPVILYLQSNGTVVGENVSGTWSKTDGSYHMNITIGEDTFSGVFCAMKDEGGTDVMTFSAVGGNESVWGVKYAAAE